MLKINIWQVRVSTYKRSNLSENRATFLIQYGAACWGVSMPIYLIPTWSKRWEKGILLNGLCTCLLITLAEDGLPWSSKKNGFQNSTLKLDFGLPWKESTSIKRLFCFHLGVVSFKARQDPRARSIKKIRYIMLRVPSRTDTARCAIWYLESGTQETTDPEKTLLTN